MIIYYFDPIPEYGSLMTMEYFRKGVMAGALIDYDGFGNPSDGEMCNRSIDIKPSLVEDVPSDITHIVWYNR